MPKVELKVLFKKLQRDDKKEVLEFHVMGELLPHSETLVMMAGNMANLLIGDSEAGTIPAEFKSIQRDSKKTVLKFEVKGDSEDKIIKLYPYAGHNVTLDIEASQMSIEEFEEAEEVHEGLEYNVNTDGTVELEGQVSIDDLPFGEPDEVNFDNEEITDDDDLLD
ncbi:hypothetical protein NSA56_11340 [Oceanobacillus caeni]|uniref:hypothetical protein n=1 Tax=Oceanobacillus caeni TaxID=405946 RepID=UPI002149C292|nr:hypothetical protein [Oceanobacillus caeni]MCR1834989.1 hypothetical protein [Oceanobacillus caeni]